MHVLHLPRLGMTMERGVVTAWLVDEGDSFEVGDELFEVETDKSTSVIEAKLPGSLRRKLVEDGADLPTGSVLAVVADPGESPGDAEVEEVLRKESRVSETEDQPSDSSSSQPIEAAGQERGEKPVRRQGRRVKAMPKARALAGERGIALEELTGTGKDGAITVDDVRAVAELTTSEVPASPIAAEIRQRRPVRGVARAMAENMARSWSRIPQFVQQATVDATALLARRDRLAAAGTKPSITDLVVAGVVETVPEVPEANSSFAGDEIILYSDVNVSVAVASENGLVVPVVHQAQKLDVQALSRRIRELADKTRSGALTAEDSQNGTITVSNLGRSGVENGMPLINAPQSAIVFTGDLIDKPVAVDGQVAVRPTIGMAVAYDHRILDGATAARFTDGLRRRLESQ